MSVLLLNLIGLLTRWIRTFYLHVNKIKKSTAQNKEKKTIYINILWNILFVLLMFQKKSVWQCILCGCIAIEGVCYDIKIVSNCIVIGNCGSVTELPYFSDNS